MVWWEPPKAREMFEDLARPHRRRRCSHHLPSTFALFAPKSWPSILCVCVCVWCVPIQLPFFDRILVFGVTQKHNRHSQWSLGQHIMDIDSQPILIRIHEWERKYSCHYYCARRKCSTLNLRKIEATFGLPTWRNQTTCRPINKVAKMLMFGQFD